MKPFSPADFWVLFFGSDETTFLVVSAVMAFVGGVLSVIGKALKGMKENPNTPSTFDTKYLLKDKWLHILFGIFCTGVTLRFSVELTGMTVTLWLSFVYGFLNYRLGNIIGGMIYALYDRMRWMQDKIRGRFGKKKEE